MRNVVKAAKTLGLSILGAGIVVAGILFANYSSPARAYENVENELIISDFDIIEVSDNVNVLDTIEEVTVKVEETKPVETVKAEETKPVETVKAEETKPVETVKAETTKPVETVKVEETKPVQVEKEEPVVTEPVPNVPLTHEQGKAMAEANAVKYETLAKETFDIINNYRIENGVAPVTMSNELTIVAMHRSAEGAWMNVFGIADFNGSKHHVRPNGTKASTIFVDYGYSGAFAENIGRYQNSPYEIVLGEYGWKYSQSHNALLLNGDYTKIGIGVAQDAQGYYYWTAIFSK